MKGTNADPGKPGQLFDGIMLFHPTNIGYDVGGESNFWAVFFKNNFRTAGWLESLTRDAGNKMGRRGKELVKCTDQGAGKAVVGEGLFFGEGLAAVCAVLLKRRGRWKAAFTRVFIINQVALAVNFNTFVAGETR